MKCPKCGEDSPREAKFCNGCGGRLELRCGGCGHGNLDGSRFCSECGEPLEVIAAARPAPHFSSPNTYTPKHLAEKILTSKAALEGERKLVTVLFADLKGSMELLADRDPEEARKLLDPVLELMMDAVHRFEGTVNQVMGDGIMALFGAPLAHEDHAVRACYAALRMQETVQRYGEGVFRTHGAPIRIRVGLNSGEVVVRAIGSDLQMDYTAVGQTTHLAARMEQTANPGTTLMTADTLRLAEGFVQVQPLGATPVKGLATPVEIFELTGASSVRSRLQAAAARGLTTFVGRTAEMEALFAALAQARAGRGQVVAVVGEPGVGKSRLVWEFTHSHRTQGCLVLEAMSVSYGKATTYLPVIDLLKAYFAIEPGDDARKIHEKVTGKLLTLDQALMPTLPGILSLLDVPAADPAWQALDPLAQRRQILDGLRALLLRESQEQPLVLIFEDLHWIDGETQGLLDGLVESLPTARALLLVNYRPEYHHAWGSKTCYTQLRLDALGPASAAELLATLLGPDPSVAPLAPLLIARTEGNPFFLEESVQSLVETGALVGTRGEYRLSRAPETLQIPATAQTILAARIDRLGPEDKRLLQTAAVVGKDVPLPLLAAIAETNEGPIRAGLGRLQAAEFLYETRLFPEAEYTFKHALTHEVAYSGLLQNRRRALHAAIVDAIERLYATRLAEHVEQLAAHAARGEVWDKAVTYSREAGRKAFMRFANQEAVRWSEQALSALEHLSPTKEVLEQAIDVRLDLRNALVPVGEAERVLRHLRQAGTLAESLKDTRRAGWVWGYTSACFWAMGDYGQALDAIERTRVLAVELGDQSLRVYADLALTWTSHSRGDYERGIAGGSEAVEILRQNPTQEHFGIQNLPAVVAHTWLALCESERGEFTSAISHGEEAVRLADARAQPWSVVSACLGLGGVHLRRANHEAARPVLERGLEAARRFDIQVWVPPLTASLGYAYGLAGRVEDSVVLLTQAVEQMAASGLHFYYTLALVWLAEAHLLAGRWEEATRLANQALARSKAHDEKGNEAYSLRLLGDIAAHSAESDATHAAGYYRDARTLAAQRGMQPLVGQCHFGLGMLAARTGTREAARDDLSVALASFRALGMEGWANQTLAAFHERELRT
jgi:class 3 adenylate cyclase/tetratricopeptide (TPR) repeat protein